VSKFAPITANLLVRKGEAAPSLASKRIFDWTREPVAPSVQEEPEEWPDEPVVEPPPYPEHTCSAETVDVPDGRRSRRLVLSLTVAEFERLGIAAAKKGMTRHELVQDTMQIYLQQLARELHGTCACLSRGDDASCRALPCSGQSGM
jgi:hypothetical protein